MAGGGGGGGGVNVSSVPNAMTYISIAVVMMGAAMFGADQNNYGVTYGFGSFQDHWSCEGYQFSDEERTEVIKVSGEAECTAAGQDANHPGDSSVWKDGQCYKTFGCGNIVGMQHQPAAWQNFISFGLNLVTAGMMIGALGGGATLSRCLGRRMTISVGGFLCFLGCLIVSYLAGKSVPVYYVGRFLTGFGCGIDCMVLPMYNAEVATLNIRGLTGSLFQFMVVIGGVVAVVALGIMPEDGASSWRQGFLIPGYFGIAVGLGAWICPESPRFLLDQEKEEQAKQALQRVRAGDVTEEYEAMKAAQIEEKAAGKVPVAQIFTTPGLRWRLFVACWLQASQQLTGVNAFLGFQSDIFTAAGYSADEVSDIPGGPSFIVQMVFIMGCATGLLLIDSPYGGRKPQLLGASLLMGPPLLLAAFTKMAGISSVTAYCVYVFSFGFQAAWGIIPWFYPAELFRMRERENALAISTFCGFLFNLLVGLITKPMFAWSPGGTFLIFGLLNIGNCIFVTTCLKETKGVALEDIPPLFDGVDKLDHLDDKRQALNDTEAINGQKEALNQ